MTDHAQSGADAAEPVPYTDETYDLRKQAAQTMLNYLERSEAMLARCEIAMRDKGSDQFTAANAAVRIMKAGGDITKALMLAAFGETRHRSLRDEAIPPPREPAKGSAIREDLDATMGLLAGELRALTEEIVEEAEKDRAGFGAPQTAAYGRTPYCVAPPQQSETPLPPRTPGATEA